MLILLDDFDISLIMKDHSNNMHFLSGEWNPIWERGKRDGLTDYKQLF